MKVGGFPWRVRELFRRRRRHGEQLRAADGYTPSPEMLAEIGRQYESFRARAPWRWLPARIRPMAFLLVGVETETLERIEREQEEHRQVAVGWRPESN